MPCGVTNGISNTQRAPAASAVPPGAAPSQTDVNRRDVYAPTTNVVAPNAGSPTVVAPNVVAPPNVAAPVVAPVAAPAGVVVAPGHGYGAGAASAPPPTYAPPSGYAPPAAAG
ncbi:hypothetical protein CH338_30830, partial [Rhodoplanes elegans]